LAPPFVRAQSCLPQLGVVFRKFRLFASLARELFRGAGLFLLPLNAGFLFPCLGATQFQAQAVFPLLRRSDSSAGFGDGPALAAMLRVMQLALAAQRLQRQQCRLGDAQFLEFAIDHPGSQAFSGTIVQLGAESSHENASAGSHGSTRELLGRPQVEGRLGSWDQARLQLWDQQPRGDSDTRRRFRLRLRQSLPSYSNFKIIIRGQLRKPIAARQFAEAELRLTILRNDFFAVLATDQLVWCPSVAWHRPTLRIPPFPSWHTASVQPLLFVVRDLAS
jgi:hypothetical protein